MIHLIAGPGLGCLSIGLNSEISLALYFDLVVGDDLLAKGR